MLQLLVQVKSVQISVRPTIYKKTCRIFAANFFAVCYYSSPLSPTSNSVGGRGSDWTPRGVRYFSIYNLCNKLMSLGRSNQTPFLDL
jgi:hypothetical protein